MNVANPSSSARLVVPPDYRLRLPGPATVPGRVRAALAQPVVSHRGPEFRAILAEALEMPMGTVKAHLHRAKRRLRHLLETELR